MKIVVHDFAGYPFPIQLSRTLAGRGHDVTHLYCGSLWTTPRGAMLRHKDDPEFFSIRPINLGENLAKYSFFKRWRQETEYGRLLRDEVRRIRPDVVLSGDTPLDAQRTLQRFCRREGIRFVFWLQDLLSVATHRILSRRYPGPGHLIGRYYVAMERATLRASDAVVLITDDFRPLMRRWGVEDARISVIENWATLDDVPVKEKANAWSVRHGLDDKICFVYTGTLGLKHNPDLLLELARHFRHRDDVRIVVMSQGLGADWLREHKDADGLSNLILQGFCPFEELADVLASADVLVGLLERDAGVYSVPSKVLTYFCAGRPVLLAVPAENLAARIVTGNGLGLVVEPDDQAGFLDAADRIIADDEISRDMGERARNYADRTFNIDRISDDFSRALLVISQ